MPELPEVQATVDGVRRHIVGRRIVSIWTDWPKMIQSHSIPAAKRFLKDGKIISIRRRAKNILIEFSHEKMMLIHLKMTGHLLVGKWRVVKKKAVPIEPEIMKTDPWNGYIRLIFYLDNGQMIGFSDLRRFGKIILGTKEKIGNLPEIRNLGPEPLEKSFTLKKFREVLSTHKRKIKQVLMDPFVIAGIGNIYSDDMLYKARIHPARPANKLSDSELRKLYNAMKQVLQKAQKLKGTSKGDYRTPAGREGKYADSRLVYQRENEPCKRCKTKIKRMKMGGRSAHFCPTCQKR